MFKLVKIEGSGTNQPEPIRIKTIEDLAYRAGCAYTLYSGSLMQADSTMMPTHVALENLEANTKDTVLCYRIQDNMIFELPTYGGNGEYTVGIKYALEVTADGAAIGIKNSSTSGVAMIHDPNGAKKQGDTVYVRITAEENY